MRRLLDPGFVADEKMREKLNEMLDNVTGEGATVFDKLKKMATEGESLSREDRWPGRHMGPREIH